MNFRRLHEQRSSLAPLAAACPGSGAGSVDEWLDTVPEVSLTSFISDDDVTLDEETEVVENDRGGEVRPGSAGSPLSGPLDPPPGVKE